MWLENVQLSQDSKAEIDEIIAKVPKAVSTFHKVDSLNFNVIIASDELVQHLNRDFRKKDRLTDVLSFPLGDDDIAGEIYICWSKVLSQAEDYGHCWRREFAYLLVHGILHLLGYEHGDDPSPEMREREEEILNLLALGR